jgi:beta-glucanase (GH16 family)
MKSIKTVNEFWNSQIPTDANQCYVSDFWASHFNMNDLLSFAEAYAKYYSDQLVLTDEEIEKIIMAKPYNWHDRAFFRQGMIDYRDELKKRRNEH